MINKETAEAIFNRNACLIIDKDVIPESIARKLTSEEAVAFAKRQSEGTYNGYGIGLGTMSYLTKKGFFLALTYQNVEHELYKDQEKQEG